MITIKLNEEQEWIVRDAFRMWLDNLAQDCSDDGEGDLEDDLLELRDKLVEKRVSLQLAIVRAQRIDAKRGA